MNAIPGGVGPASSEPTLMRGLLEGVPDPAAVLGLDMTYLAFNRAYADTLAATFCSSAGLGNPMGASVDGTVDSEGRTVRDALLRARAGASVAQQLKGVRSHFHPLRGQDGQVLGVLHLLQTALESPHAQAKAQAPTVPTWFRLSQALRLAGSTGTGPELPRIRVFTWDAALGDLTWSGSLQDFAVLVGHLPAPTEPSERMNPEDSRRLVERISEWQREGRTEVSFDFRVVRPDGTERSLDAWARLVPASVGVPARLIGINVDVTELARTEHHLAESRAAYERLFNLTLDGIVLLALRPGKPAQTIRSNLALETLSGRSSASLAGTAFSELLPEGERSGFEKQLWGLTPDKGVQHEFTIRTPTGQSLHIEATSRAFVQDGRPMVLSVLRDITSRVLRSQELLSREQWFRTMSDSLPSIVWSADKTGQVTYYNANWFSYTGLSPSEGLGEGWNKVIHPDDVARLRGAWWHAVEHHERYNQEGRVRGKDGHYRWFLHRGYPLSSPVKEGPHFVGTSTDIDPIKASEVALREREDWLGSIVDTIPHMVWTANAQGAVEFQSRQLVQYTGAPPREPPQLPWHFHPDDVERASASWQRMLKGGAATSEEFRLFSHEGTYRWFSVAAAPLKDSDGRVVRWTGTWTDITPQKAAVELLKEADKRKDEFLAVLSHELRNPLAPIRLSLGLLEQVPAGSPPWKRAFNILHRQTDQLARLVDDLLDLTRMTRGKIRLQLKPLDVVSLVNGCVEDHREEFDIQGVSLEVALPPGPGWVQADGSRISQAIGNLLQNAAKFTPRGGSARVSVQMGDEDIEVAVEDTGQGISPDLMPRLFEPFVQEEAGIERSKGGLGLGLALVRTLVKMHGGSVTASSQGVGRGARLAITLPRITAPQLVAAAATPASSSRQKHVLVIEDNEDAAESLRAFLELEGHLVEVASDGMAGVANARSNRPDVVFCDIGLPGMDGYAVARALRATPEFAQVRLYALTGYASAEDVRRAKEAGFSALLAKPASPAQLDDAVQGRD